MKDPFLDRLQVLAMTYYRTVYKNSPMWNKENDKTVIVYMEQGFGDQIFAFRFLKYIKAKKVILHTSKELHRLFEHHGYECIDKEQENLPNHDFHTLSLSLPFLFYEIPLEPYIKIEEKFELPTKNNIGIAWEGNHDHPSNDLRNCNLSLFKSLDFNLYCLQSIINDSNLINGAKDMNLLGVELNDFYDTAKLINSLDYVISVDTAVLHLAGAMGKKGWGLLGDKYADPRWDTVWYPTIKMLKQDFKESLSFISDKLSTSY